MPIDVLPGAKIDIDRLAVSDPDALAVILAFLEEAEADPGLIDKFTAHGDVEFESFDTNVKGWVGARRAGANLFRIRILNTPATSYRVVYGYEWQQRRIGLLALVHKDDLDYDDLGSETAKRILRDWNAATGGRAT